MVFLQLLPACVQKTSGIYSYKRSRKEQLKQKATSIYDKACQEFADALVLLSTYDNKKVLREQLKNHIHVRHDTIIHNSFISTNFDAYATLP